MSAVRAMQENFGYVAWLLSGVIGLLLVYTDFDGADCEPHTNDFAGLFPLKTFLATWYIGQLTYVLLAFVVRYFGLQTYNGSTDSYLLAWFTALWLEAVTRFWVIIGVVYLLMALPNDAGHNWNCRRGFWLVLVNVIIAYLGSIWFSVAAQVAYVSGGSIRSAGNQASLLDSKTQMTQASAASAAATNAYARTPGSYL